MAGLNDSSEARTNSGMEKVRNGYRNFDVVVARICRLTKSRTTTPYIQIVREKEAQPRLRVKQIGVSQ